MKRTPFTGVRFFARQPGKHRSEFIDLATNLALQPPYSFIELIIQLSLTLICYKKHCQSFANLIGYIILIGNHFANSESKYFFVLEENSEDCRKDYRKQDLF